MQVRTLTPAINYTATFYFEHSFPAQINYTRAGIMLRNSISGLFTDFSRGYDSSIGYFLNLSRFSTPTAWSSTAKLTVLPQPPNWLRVRDNGTNRIYEFSYNGVDWVFFFSVVRTDFITPDQIGWGAANDLTGQTGYLRLRSLAGVS
jgi:hypothetical protein